MTLIYLTRHGQTKWNEERRLQGWKDAPLTQLGLSQAKKLGNRLKEITFDAIYSSDSQRAFETAQIITGKAISEINLIKDLRELHFGDLEGKTIKEFENEFPDQYYNFWNAPHNYQPPSGENLSQISQRVLPKIDEIIKKHKNEVILIVCHTIVVKIILANFDNKEIKDIWNMPYIHPTSLSIIEFVEDKPIILKQGDTSHFD